ncbi:MAG: alpha-L-rhamnosidase, partial [Chloroflexi bacterium]
MIRAHISADERYELFVDGQSAARGSERGDPQHWFFESYDLSLPPGDHMLVARVWSLGELAPWAQMSTHHGFLFAVEKDWIPLLATGAAAWEAKVLPGYTFTDPAPTLAAGANLVVDGNDYAWGFEAGQGDDWRPAISYYPGMRPGRSEALDPADRSCLPPYHELIPARLPEMFKQPVRPGKVRYIASYDRLRVLPPERKSETAGDPDSSAEGVVPVQMASHLTGEAPAWAAMLQGTSSVTLPPHTHRRILIDLENYFCAYPRVQVSGGAGASIGLVWAEALYNEPFAQTKGQRDEIEGKYFYGVVDTFLPDGAPSRWFDTLWWQCGRYLEIRVETQDQPLTIERLELTETRYPLEMQSGFQASDPRLERAIPILMRGLQMCAHETYFDCPYYEQLMYVGDTRLETLVTYTVTGDDRLPHKALEMFDRSRMVNGLTQSRYPSHIRQTIPPFSLWYVGMVYDHASWRGNLPFIQALMPGVRGVLDAFLSYRNEQGLVAGPPGWNFMDWSHGWESGIPPEGDFGASAPINWLTILALDWAAQLETWLGEPELAVRWERYAANMTGKVCAAFWDPALSRFCDAPGQQRA